MCTYFGKLVIHIHTIILRERAELVLLQNNFDDITMVCQRGLIPRP